MAIHLLRLGYKVPPNTISVEGLLYDFFYYFDEKGEYLYDKDAVKNFKSAVFIKRMARQAVFDPYEGRCFTLTALPYETTGYNKDLVIDTGCSTGLYRGRYYDVQFGNQCTRVDYPYKRTTRCSSHIRSIETIKRIHSSKTVVWNNNALIFDDGLVVDLYGTHYEQWDPVTFQNPLYSWVNYSWIDDCVCCSCYLCRGENNGNLYVELELTGGSETNHLLTTACCRVD